MYSSVTVANCLLDMAERDSESLTPMKIQKLVYIANGWHLGLFRKPLVSEEVEAWDWGPVFPKLYHTFKHYGKRAITQKAIDPSPGEYSSSRVKEEAWEFLEEVWRVYQPYTGIQLANLTHKPDAPWNTVTSFYRKRFRSIPHHLVIQNSVIEEHYKMLANQDG